MSGIELAREENGTDKDEIKMTDQEKAERLAKSPDYIKELCKLPDKKLSKWLDLVRSQQDLAIKQKNEKAMIELMIREEEIAQARLIVNFG